MWLDPFCHNLELANQADHEDDLPENLSEITDLWNSPARTHVRQSEQEARPCVKCSKRRKPVSQRQGGRSWNLLRRRCLLLTAFSSCFFLFFLPHRQGTFGREPQAKPEDDRYLRAAIQEYDNIAKLGQIMREGPIKVRRQHSTYLDMSKKKCHSFL